MTDQDRQVVEFNHSIVDQLVEANTKFAFAFYHRLFNQFENLVFSPFSLSGLLALTLEGARGVTASEMQSVMYLDAVEEIKQAYQFLYKQIQDIGDSGHVQINNVNSLWRHDGYEFLADFLSISRDFFGAMVQSLNYEDPVSARKMINEWVVKATEGKIEDLIPAGTLTPLTRLVLANAIYFKGDWAKPFDVKETRDAPFYLLDGRQVRVRMMNLRAVFNYRWVKGLQILELPYSGNEIIMLVLLPVEKDGLEELESALNYDNLQEWLKWLSPCEVVVSLPKMEVSSFVSLKNVLTEMGMASAFDDADFSGMNGNLDLYIDEVLHQAFVLVNEVGTEAAAATAAVMGVRSMPMAPPVFCADHPFLFLILEKSTKTILFLGRLLNPTIT